MKGSFLVIHSLLMRFQLRIMMLICFMIRSLTYLTSIMHVIFGIIGVFVQMRVGWILFCCCCLFDTLLVYSIDLLYFDWYICILFSKNSKKPVSFLRCFIQKKNWLLVAQVCTKIDVLIVGHPPIIVWINQSIVRNLDIISSFLFCYVSRTKFTLIILLNQEKNYILQAQGTMYMKQDRK